MRHSPEMRCPLICSWRENSVKRGGGKSSDGAAQVPQYHPSCFFSPRVPGHAHSVSALGKGPAGVPPSKRGGLSSGRRWAVAPPAGHLARGRRPLPPWVVEGALALLQPCLCICGCANNSGAVKVGGQRHGGCYGERCATYQAFVC